ncbi:MAG: glutaredoxin family protein [Euryarchaeota archaeon]|nr:glutaredoxin family protein [Euryarchaeota archaeon]
MAVKPTRVEGRDAGDVLIYALSTCGWCKRTKLYLKRHGIAYSYIDVDLLGDKDREETMKEVTKWNPRCSLPTIVLGNKKAIVGFKEKEMAEALKL